MLRLWGSIMVQRPAMLAIAMNSGGQVHDSVWNRVAESTDSSIKKESTDSEEPTEVGMERTVSTEDMKAKLNRKDIKVVETLAPERFREAHLPGALNIPPDKVKDLAPQLLPNKNAEIITYCASSH